MHSTISIIVPVYQVEHYLEKCIDSILAQTFSNFELILVDDGSPDRCGMICDYYAGMDERIQVIHKGNGGVSSARNAGLEVATGDYIGFVDSDDYIEGHMYETLYNGIVNTNSDIVVCDFHTLDEKGEILNHDKELTTQHEVKEYTNIQSLEAIFKPDGNTDFGTGLNPIWILMWNKLFKREVFKDIRFSDGVNHQGYEDERIAHRLLYQSKKTLYIHQKLYYYLIRQNSLSNFKFDIKKLERIYALKQRADFFREVGLSALHDQALKNFMDIFFWNYYTARTRLIDVRKDLKQLKRTMDKSFRSFIHNPLISWKQKMFIGLFIISPSVWMVVKKRI